MRRTGFRNPVVYIRKFGISWKAECKWKYRSLILEQPGSENKIQSRPANLWND